MRLRATIAAVGFLTPIGASATINEQASLSAVRKFQQISEQTLPSGTTVEFSEDELNAFLQFHGSPLVPDAVQDPELELRVGGAEFRAQIELGEAASASDSLPWMMRLLLRGTRAVAVDVDYSVREGRASAEIVRLTIEGVEIPGDVLEWLLEAYAPPELKPFLSGEQQEVGLGLRELRILEGLAVATVE